MTKIKQTTYQTIITDVKEKSSIQNHFSTSTVLMMPKFQEYQDIINYFLQLEQTINTKNQETLIVSNNQVTLLPAKALGLDTCFLNNGLNDIVEFIPTHEISTTKIKQKK